MRREVLTGAILGLSMVLPALLGSGAEGRLLWDATHYEEEAILEATAFNIFVSRGGFDGSPNASNRGPHGEGPSSSSPMSIELGHSEHRLLVSFFTIRTYNYQEYRTMDRYEDGHLVELNLSVSKANQTENYHSQPLVFNVFGSGAFRLTGHQDEDGSFHVFWLSTSNIADARIDQYLFYIYIDENLSLVKENELIYYELTGNTLPEPEPADEEESVGGFAPTAMVISVLFMVAVLTRSRLL